MKGKRKKKSGSRSFYGRLRRHLGTDPAELAVVERTFPSYHRPNLQLAIEKLIYGKKKDVALDGIVLHQEYEGVSLSKLAHKEIAKHFPSGPVEYRDAEMADGKSLACVSRALFRFQSRSGPIALLVTQSAHTYPPQLAVQAMAPDRSDAEDFLRELAIEIERAPAFRGHIISLELDCHRQLSVVYHKLPPVQSGQIILPEAVLKRIDRHARDFVANASRLLKAGRHLKRGILLHGPPGTGKTLCAMYLASQMPGRTVMILTGGGISSIESSGAMARALAPATIILEDVDLIGTMREHQSVGANALLFELLNQMDGLAEDSDVLFVLTTNRPDVLEPALASRPGRIDQAIEIPLPDADCRRRLFDLYAQGLNLRLENLDAVIERSQGVSAAFIRELLRKACLMAAESDGQGDELIIDHSHIDRAIEELLIAGGPLTQRLLGVGLVGS